MFNPSHNFDIHSRFLTLTEELSSSLDPEFDAYQDDLEREFQELRLQLGQVE